MPRKMSTRDFVINQLRYLVTWKKTPPGTRLRALFALAVIEKMLDVQFRDSDPNSGDTGERIPEQKETHDAVTTMLDSVQNMAKRGGGRGNQLSTSDTGRG